MYQGTSKTVWLDCYLTHNLSHKIGIMSSKYLFNGPKQSAAYLGYICAFLVNILVKSIRKSAFVFGNHNTVQFNVFVRGVDQSSASKISTMPVLYGHMLQSCNSLRPGVPNGLLLSRTKQRYRWLCVSSEVILGTSWMRDKVWSWFWLGFCVPWYTLRHYRQSASETYPMKV